MHLLPEVKDYNAFRASLSREQARNFTGASALLTNGYKSMILPEQLGALLGEVPDRSILKTVNLWEHKPSNAAADADHGGNTNIYQYPWLDAADYRHCIYHEWSHHADRDVNAFAPAAELEARQPKCYYADNYAKTNIAENLAVHLGEELLNHDADRFFVLAKEAPLRTVALREILRQRLANAEAQGVRSPYHSQFMERVSYIAKVVVPKASNGATPILVAMHNLL